MYILSTIFKQCPYYPLFVNMYNNHHKICTQWKKVQQFLLVDAFECQIAFVDLYALTVNMFEQVRGEKGSPCMVGCGHAEHPREQRDIRD